MYRVKETHINLEKLWINKSKFCFTVLQTGLQASGASEELDNVQESVPIKSSLLEANDSIATQCNQFS